VLVDTGLSGYRLVNIGIGGYCTFAVFGTGVY
jgi:hypothetical protein